MIDLRGASWLEWLGTVDPFSSGYLSCSSAYHTVRLAHALRAYWADMPAVIEPDDRLVGRIEPRGVGGFSFGSGITCNSGVAEELKQQFPEWGEHLDELVTFWRSWEPGSRMSFPEDERFISGQNVYWAGWGGHTVLGFEQLLAEGTEGIRETIRRYQTGEADPGKYAFREALLVVCDGIDAFADNYAKAAARMAEKEDDDARREELLAIADRCSRVPRHGARTFPEALQSFWFIHLLDGADSPGRFDQYMFPYYQRDRDAGRLTQVEAQGWTDHLWKRFNDTRSWNLCVGGLRPDGSDGTNDLTFMALEATRRIQKVAPNLSLRLHRNSPPILWRKAVEVIETGVGMPALYNDDLFIPALMRYGIPEEDARDYAMNGCSQVDIQGRSHMGLEDGEMNLLKCLELALHDGFDPYTQRQIGPHTGDPRSFTSFEQVWQAYTAQVEAFSKRLTDAANIVQKAHAETSPNLLRSLFVKDCIEKGRDFKAGGPRYNHGQILTQGIANTADSLAVIRKLVFEEGRISMDELLDAMDQDFPDESFRQMLIHEAPKFGNDDDSVDSLAAEMIDHFYRHLNTYRTWRGGTFAGGSIVFTRAVPFGAKAGATPDGRKAYTPLADSVGPAQGRDARGPTAMLSSVAKVPQILAQSAYVLNVKFTPQVIRESKDKVIALFQTYFRKGGQQIQVNVVDKGSLLRAKQHPEQYESLIVRVGGFSDYFVRLSPALQNDVIARTEQPLQDTSALPLTSPNARTRNGGSASAD
jgi:pyruvate formate-lyase/glycerol dehydratase family glycyl radical enzyme